MTNFTEFMFGFMKVFSCCEEFSHSMRYHKGDTYYLQVKWCTHTHNPSKTCSDGLSAFIMYSQPGKEQLCSCRMRLPRAHPV